jgi:hypothetical protein
MITFRDNGAAFMMALQRLAPSTNCVASTLRDFSSRVPSTLDQSQHFIDSFRNIELNCFNVAVLLSSIQTPRVRIGNSNHHQVDGEKSVTVDIRETVDMRKFFFSNVETEKWFIFHFST